MNPVEEFLALKEVIKTGGRRDRRRRLRLPDLTPAPMPGLGGSGGGGGGGDSTYGLAPGNSFEDAAAAIAAGADEVLDRPLRGRLAKTVGKGLAVGGALAASSAGVAALGAAAEKIYNAITKKRDFDNMLEANPHLRAYQEATPEEFTRMFSALRTMNPDFTKDPLVAGAYMAKAMEQPVETRGFTAVDALRLRQPKRPGPFTETALSGFARGLGAFQGRLSGGEVSYPTYDY